MRHHPLTAVYGLLVILAVGLVGCDETPSTVGDFEIQGNMESPTALTVTPDLNPEFEVVFQGLESVPSIEAPSRIDVESVRELEGDPREGGSARWRLALNGEVNQLLEQDNVLIRGTTTRGREIVDTISASVTTSLSVQAEFTTRFVTLADYEGDVDSSTYGGTSPEDFAGVAPPFTEDQRVIQTSGAETSLEIDGNANNNPAGSNGIAFLNIQSNTSGSSITIQRRANLPGLDFFSFLIRPGNSPFTLTIVMEEETGSGTARRQLDLPIPPGNQWLRIGVPLEFFGEDFNPVAERSGGNGPLVSISFRADGEVSYDVDQMLFGIEGTGPRAEFEDFEVPALSFGPPFVDGIYRFTTGDDSVATGSDGFTARRVTNSGAFGYNHGDGGRPLFVDVEGDDTFSFYGRGIDSDCETTVFFENPGGPQTTVTLPEGQWRKFEFDLGEVVDNPSALSDQGVGTIVFLPGEDCLYDDIKIMPK